MTWISAIVAMDQNRLIGAGDSLPWRLPDDMGWFRRQTMGKPVIMGRKTYESIPAKFRPLPGRRNIVLTRDVAYRAPGAAVVRTVAAALAAAAPADEVMIAGGAQIYAAFWPHINRLYLTEVDGRFSGDVYFPDVDWELWHETVCESHPRDARHAHAFTWRILERR